MKDISVLLHIQLQVWENILNTVECNGLEDTKQVTGPFEHVF